MMKRFVFVASITFASIFATMFASTARANPNLVVNGSFEQGQAGLGSFAGWTTVLGDDGTFVDSNGQTGTHYGQASNGLWSAFFGSTRADGGASITQTFATNAGQTYVFGFDFANDNGGLAASDAFTALVNGAALFSVDNLAAQDYVHRMYSFVATGSTTSLAFRGYNDNGYVELDNVTVAAVPEPGSLALIGGGLLALASRRREPTKVNRR